MNGCRHHLLGSKLFIKPLGFCNELFEGGWRRSEGGKVKAMYPFDRDYLAMDTRRPLSCTDCQIVFLMGSVGRGDSVVLPLAGDRKFPFPYLCLHILQKDEVFLFNRCSKCLAPLTGEQ